MLVILGTSHCEYAQASSQRRAYSRSDSNRIPTAIVYSYYYPSNGKYNEIASAVSRSLSNERISYRKKS